MTTLNSFSKDASKRYLQSILFIDDEIFDQTTGHPVEITSQLAGFQSQYKSLLGEEVKVEAAAIDAGKDPHQSNAISVDEKIPYHPKQLVQSFARQGIVCALYEPDEGFQSDNNSEIFKLCERADVVIFDWDLFNRDGANVLPLIRNLVDDSQNSTPHHVRLFFIYTTTPDLSRVANSIYEFLHAAKLKVDPIEENQLTLNAGATRITILGKPDVPGRAEVFKGAEIKEEDLAEKVIDEFAAMNTGLLRSFALYGMSSLRRNSKKLLDKFSSDLDGVFLLQRALLLGEDDAFNQLSELISEEVHAIILDDQLAQIDLNELALDAASLQNQPAIDWTLNQGGTAMETVTIAKSFLGGGTAALNNNSYKKPTAKGIERFHTSFNCAQTHADKKLAILYALRTRYFRQKKPLLGIGTIVRVAKNESWEYLICFMPDCDTIRLKHGANETTTFPFWKLDVGAGHGSIGLVIQTAENTYMELYVSGRPKDKMTIESFSPNASLVVEALQEDNGNYYFQGTNVRMEWVAQLKPAHSQRIAHSIGQAFSRVSVIEAEWLRLASEKK